MNYKVKYLIFDFICALLLLLFLYTGINKIVEHHLFQYFLTRTPVLSGSAKWWSWVLPFSELFIALLLFIKSLRITGLYLSILLLFVFTVYLIYLVTNFSDLPCNCGGVLNQLSWKQHIFFNISFLMLAVSAVALDKFIKKYPSSPPP